MQPNSPIIILILLTVFHKFAMSLGAKHRWSCTERFSFLLGEFHLPFDGNKPWHCRGWTHRPGNGLSFKKNPKSFFLASVNWSTLSWVENLAWSLCQSPQMGPSQGRELSYMKSHNSGVFDKESALNQPLKCQQIFCTPPTRPSPPPPPRWSFSARSCWVQHRLFSDHNPAFSFAISNMKIVCNCLDIKEC